MRIRVELKVAEGQIVFDWQLTAPLEGEEAVLYDAIMGTIRQHLKLKPAAPPALSGNTELLLDDKGAGNLTGDGNLNSTVKI